MGFWRETPWLLAARWRIAANSLSRAARWRRLTYLLVGSSLAFLTLVALLSSYVVTRAIIELTKSPALADVVVSSVLTGAFILSFLLSFTIALAALFLSKDLDLLLSAPVGRTSVFASKLIGGLLPAQLIVLGLALIPLVGHGLAMQYDHNVLGVHVHYGPSYYLAVLLALALMPWLPAAVGALAVLLIVQRVSAHRLGEIVGLMVVAMTLSIALVAGSANQLQQAVTVRDLIAILGRIRYPYSPAEWLTIAVAASGRHDYALALRWFGMLALLSLVMLVPLTLAADRLYYDGWLRMQSADQRTSARRARLPWNRVDRAASLGRPSGWLAWLSAPAVAIVRKDLRIIPRDLTNMAQVLSPLAIGLFFVLQQLLYPVRLGGANNPQPFLTPLLVMLAAGVAAGVSAMIMARFGLTAFSLEGLAYWVVKSAPIGRRQLILAKFLVAYIPYLLLGGFLIVLLNGARAISDALAAGGPFGQALLAGLDPGLLLYSGFVLAVMGVGILSINLALGAARPNLRWDTPHEMLTPDVGCLSLGLYGAYGLVAGLTLALPAAVSGFPVVRLTSLLWWVGIALGLGVTAIVAAGSFRLALQEVDAIGE
jgi:ABC-2 type transport system permease protein